MAVLGINLPNLEWQPWDSDARQVILDLRPRVLLVPLYAQKLAATSAKIVDLARLTALQPGTRVLYRAMGDFLPSEPAALADEIHSRYRAWLTPGEIIPWNEWNLEQQSEDWGAYTSFALTCLGELRRDLPGVKLHLPALSPNGNYLKGYAYLAAISNLRPLFDVLDLHCYPGSLGDVAAVGARFPEKELAITEFNQILPSDMLRQAGRATAACYFILSGTSDQAPYWLTTNPAYYADFKKAGSVPMTNYPGAIWDPSPNFGYPQGSPGRNGHPVLAIVHHIESGSESATDGWFENPASEVSAHYSVAKDGTVRQHVQEADAAWGNGIDFAQGYASYKSDLSVPLIKQCWDTLLSPNLVTISIEHEGKPGDTMPETQYQASLALTKALFAHYHLPLVKTSLLGHFQIDSVNRPSCPGPTHPWGLFYHDLNLLNPTGGSVSDDQKKQVLDHLAVLWGYAEQLKSVADSLKSATLEDTQAALHERILAIKTVLGLS